MRRVRPRLPSRIGTGSQLLQDPLGERVLTNLEGVVLLNLQYGPKLVSLKLIDEAEYLAFRSLQMF